MHGILYFSSWLLSHALKWPDLKQKKAVFATSNQPSIANGESRIFTLSSVEWEGD